MAIIFWKHFAFKYMSFIFVAMHILKGIDDQND